MQRPRATGGIPYERAGRARTPGRGHRTGTPAHDESPQVPERPQRRAHGSHVPSPGGGRPGRLGDRPRLARRRARVLRRLRPHRGRRFGGYGLRRLGARAPALDRGDARVPRSSEADDRAGPQLLSRRRHRPHARVRPRGCGGRLLLRLRRHPVRLRRRLDVPAVGGRSAQGQGAALHGGGPDPGRRGAPDRPREPRRGARRSRRGDAVPRGGDRQERVVRRADVQARGEPRVGRRRVPGCDGRQHRARHDHRDGEPSAARRVPADHPGGGAQGGDRVARRALPRREPMNLEPLLAPRSIAIIGASEKPDSWAPEIYRSLMHLGYGGELYPINPKYEEVWGRPCHASILEVPAKVDLVVVVVPARVAVRMVDDCGRAGARGVMVVSSGFAEAGEEGRELQAELRATAMRHRLPVLGPNVEGFVNYVERVAPYGTTPPPEPVPGGISVISQSGTVAWTMNQMASDRGVGLRIILGVGNEAVVGLGDMFEWAAADPHTQVVTSYVETMRDVEGIGHGLDALRRAGKPVLICAPAGRSEAARRSIVAHTGALAGNTALRDSWLRGLGAILVEDPVTMFEAAVLLSHHRRLRTTGVAAALQSGGACTLFAEAAGAHTLSLPEFAPKTKAVLKRVLPHFASQNNPLDVTGQAAVETEMFCGALEALANDPAVGFVAFDAFPPRLEEEGVWAEPVLRKVRDLQKDTGVAFASVAMSALAYGNAARRFVDRAKLPFLQGHRASAGAIRALIDLQGVRDRAIAELPKHPNRTAALRVLRGLSGPLDEAQGAKLLELYGVPRPQDSTVGTPEAAATAARSIGFPVAVKALAPQPPP